MEELTVDGLCAVCSLSRRRCSMLPPWQVRELPNLHLLDKDGEVTPSCPRDGSTVVQLDGKRYCLQPDAIHGERCSVCDECMAALQQGKVPPASLARFDTGAKPAHLAWPTLIELLCIGFYRPFRYIMLCTPGSSSSGSLLGHVVAFPNPSPSQLLRKLPLPPDELPQHITVALLTPCTTIEQLKARAAHCPALRVRGPVIAAWARHLAHIHKGAGVTVDEGLIAAWASWDDAVPLPLLHGAPLVRTKEEADMLRSAHAHLREGYADPE
jgi:hypothetical protein